MNYYYIASTSNSRQCGAGSLDYDDNVIEENSTYILTDNEYKVECEGIVNSWEFC